MIRRGLASVLVALALAGCAAVEDPAPPAGSADATPARLRFTGCDTLTLFRAVDAEAERHLPPGFRIGESGEPSPTAFMYVGYQLCRDVEGDAFHARDVEQVAWGVIVAPPREFRNDSMEQYATTTGFSSDPAFARVHAAWGVGAEGRIAVERHAVGAGLVRLVVTAENATMRLRIEAQPSPGAGPNDDTSGGTIRVFGVDGAALGGIVDSVRRKVEAPNEAGFTFGTYEAEGATGLLGAYPSGTLPAKVGLVGGYDYESWHVPPPGAPRR